MRKNVNAGEKAIYSPSLESDEGNINVAGVASPEGAEQNSRHKNVYPF